MHMLQAILMGIVQGLSEFLPISSSAHLVISSNFYKYFTNITETALSQEIFLDIMLHLGTLIAVLIFFRKDIAKIIKAFFHGIKKKDFSDKDARMAIYIMVGTIITAAVAYPLENFAKTLVLSPHLVGMLLVSTGTYLCLCEAFSRKVAGKSDEIDFATSIWVAIAQGFAVLPGFSRSGLTIATALLNKKTRVEAAKYSFLLSIPIILGASMIYPIIKIDISEFANYNWVAISVGTVVSCISGYLCIKYFIKFVEKYSLSFFGYYCIIVGVFTAIFFMSH